MKQSTSKILSYLAIAAIGGGSAALAVGAIPDQKPAQEAQEIPRLKESHECLFYGVGTHCAVSKIHDGDVTCYLYYDRGVSCLPSGSLQPEADPSSGSNP